MIWEFISPWNIFVTTSVNKIIEVSNIKIFCIILFSPFPPTPYFFPPAPLLFIYFLQRPIPWVFCIIYIPVFLCTWIRIIFFKLQHRLLVLRVNLDNRVSDPDFSFMKTLKKKGFKIHIRVFDRSRILTPGFIIFPCNALGNPQKSFFVVTWPQRGGGGEGHCH